MTITLWVAIRETEELGTERTLRCVTDRDQWGAVPQIGDEIQLVPRSRLKPAKVTRRLIDGPDVHIMFDTWVVHVQYPGEQGTPPDFERQLRQGGFEGPR